MPDVHGVRDSAQVANRPQGEDAAKERPLVQDGDAIIIDAERNRIDVALSDAELSRRRSAWKPPAYKFTRGTLYKYIKNVKSASEGCVTDE